jgi:hypothetical protein
MRSACSCSTRSTGTRLAARLGNLGARCGGRGGICWCMSPGCGRARNRTGSARRNAADGRRNHSGVCAAAPVCAAEPLHGSYYFIHYVEHLFYFGARRFKLGMAGDRCVVHCSSPCKGNHRQKTSASTCVTQRAASAVVGPPECRSTTRSSHCQCHRHYHPRSAPLLCSIRHRARVPVHQKCMHYTPTASDAVSCSNV